MELALFVLILGVLIVAVVQHAIAASRKAAELFRTIVTVLEANPTDQKSHAYAVKLFCEMNPPNRQAYSGPLYKLALDIVAQHPENISCRVFALETGRLHHGLHRPDGNVTVYDEQAIQNDILARSGSAPQVVPERSQ